ncbi:MAG: hypothetical protein ACI9R3_006557 [Verrucomicrobiales bacterium]|jgi:hypothetical protein
MHYDDGTVQHHIDFLVDGLEGMQFVVAQEVGGDLKQTTYTLDGQQPLWFSYIGEAPSVPELVTKGVELPLVILPQGIGHGVFDNHFWWDFETTTWKSGLGSGKKLLFGELVAEPASSSPPAVVFGEEIVPYHCFSCLPTQTAFVPYRISLTQYFKGIDEIQASEMMLPDGIAGVAQTDPCCRFVVRDTYSQDNDRDIRENARFAADAMEVQIRTLAASFPHPSTINVHLIGFSAGGLTSMETSRILAERLRGFAFPCAVVQIDLITIDTPYQFGNAFLRFFADIFGELVGSRFFASVGSANYGEKGRVRDEDGDWVMDYIAPRVRLCKYIAFWSEEFEGLVDEDGGPRAGEDIVDDPRMKPWDIELRKLRDELNGEEINHGEYPEYIWKTFPSLVSPKCECTR